MHEEDNHTLHDLKKRKDGGLEIIHRELMKDENQEYFNEHTFNSPVNPHQDLTEQMDEMKTVLAKCYCINSIDFLRTSKDLDQDHRDAFDVVESQIDKLMLETMRKIEITGVSISGQKGEGYDRRGIVIKGKILQDNNMKVAMNSPLIKLDQEQFGFESQLTQIVETLEDEVKKYLFEGRKAERDLFDTPEDEKNPSEELEVVD